MKLRATHLAALAAITFAGPASASTVLLTDNFNTAQDGANINNQPGLSNDQGGTLDPLTSSISYTGNRPWTVRRGFTDGGSYVSEMALIGNGTPYGDPNGLNTYSSLDHNFATDMTVGNPRLEVTFNVKAMSGFGGDTTNWGSIQLGSAQNAWVLDGTNKFSTLFRDNGGIDNVGGTASNTLTFTDGDQITLLFSNAAGTGSAFASDGATDVAKLFINGTLGATYTGLNLTSSDGYITFAAHSANLAVDNLVISAIPEPGAALLGGLGMLCLLRRRR